MASHSAQSSSWKKTAMKGAASRRRSSMAPLTDSICSSSSRLSSSISHSKTESSSRRSPWGRGEGESG